MLDVENNSRHRDYRPLSRRSAQRYVDRRARRRMRRNIGDVYSLIFQTFLLCCFIALNVKVQHSKDYY